MRALSLRRACVLTAVLVGLAPAVGCTQESDGSADPESPATPTAASPSPTASPTPAEVRLDLGEPAVFRLQAGSGAGSRVRLAVTDVTQGKIGDLSDFVLDEETKSSTPYYATVRVRNAGQGDLSGARVTLWGLDSEGTVRPPAEIVGGFAKCRHSRMPRKFTVGESARTCLVYLLPEGTSLDAVQYRFNDRPPFTWPVG